MGGLNHPILRKFCKEVLIGSLTPLTRAPKLCKIWSIGDRLDVSTTLSLKILPYVCSIETENDGIRHYQSPVFVIGVVRLELSSRIMGYDKE